MSNKGFKRYRREKVNISIDRQVAQISELNAFGEIRKSPDGLMNAFCERTIGAARIILLLENMLIWERKFENPKEFAVTNKGAMCVCEAHENEPDGRQELRGTFFVLSPLGDVVISERFGANLGNCGFVDGERFAWVATYNSYNEDSKKLIVYSTYDGKKLFKVDLMSYDVYEIVLIENNFVAKSKMFGDYVYNFQGEFQNENEVKERFENFAIECGSVWDLLSIIDKKLANNEVAQMSDSKFYGIMNLLNKAVIKLEEYNFQKSRVERRIGELFLARGEDEKAITHLENALKINPKVGVKKLLQKLKGK